LGRAASLFLWKRFAEGSEIWSWATKGQCVNPRVEGKEKAMTGAVRITELDDLRENFAY
jgi:hypothetical protein